MQLTAFRRDVAGLSLEAAARKAGIPQAHAASLEQRPERASVGAVASYIRALGGGLEIQITAPSGVRYRLVLALVALVAALLGCGRVPPGEAVFSPTSESMHAGAMRAAARLEASTGIVVRFEDGAAPMAFVDELVCAGEPSDGCTHRHDGVGSVAGSVLGPTIGLDAPRYGEPYAISIDSRWEGTAELDDLILREWFGWFGLAPASPALVVSTDESDLEQATRAAAARIEKATGLGVAVNQPGAHGAALPVFRSSDLGSHEGWYSGEDIAIATSVTEPDLVEWILLHELVHALGVAHVDEPGALMLETAPGRLLTTADLEALCTVAACGWMAPEAE